MDRLSLMPIGTFASATQLSAKALRLYADNGLLVPAFVDDATGYRYYRPEQVREARLVRVLRDMDMPLAEIARCLAQPSNTAAIAAEHMESSSRRFAQQRTAHQTLLALLASAAPAAAQVTFMQIAEVIVATQIFTATTHNMLPRARGVLVQLVATVEAGTFDTAVFYVSLTEPPRADEETTLELRVPLARIGIAAHLLTETQPALNAATTALPMRDGALADEHALAGATDALFDWFDRQGKTLHSLPFIIAGHETLQLAWPLE
ncbi:MAG: MerR family transcriptional regulator [Burkholderiaceae bacterium]